jgi:type IV pilus assembly protein PilV
MHAKSLEFLPLQHRTGGFSLVEVLVSILVLAVGLMGAAVMQLNAARTTDQSNFHNNAVVLATQIADEMRANSTEMGNASSSFLKVRYNPTNPVGSFPPDCYKSDCTSSEWATMSEYEWRTKMRLSLPSGRLEICRDSAVIDSNKNLTWCSAASGGPDAPVVIKIGWYDKDPNGAQVLSSAPLVALLVSPVTQ